MTTKARADEETLEKPKLREDDGLAGGDKLLPSWAVCFVLFCFLIPDYFVSKQVHVNLSYL